MDGQFDDAPDDVTELTSFRHTEQKEPTIEVSFPIVYPKWKTITQYKYLNVSL